jgi:hypothetical protein
MNSNVPVELVEELIDRVFSVEQLRLSGMDEGLKRVAANLKKMSAKLTPYDGSLEE